MKYMIRYIIYVTLFTFVFIAINVVHTQEQEKYNLSTKVAEGQKFNVSVESSIDFDITVQSQDKSSSSNSISITNKNKFAVEISEVKNDKPKTMSVTCISSTLARSGSHIEPIGPMKTQLDGKSFILKRRGSSFEVTSKDGNPSDAETNSLGRWEDYRLFLPEEEVAVGESWEANIEDILALLSNIDDNIAEGDLRCKLESATNGKAEISITGKAQATIQSGAKGKKGNNVKTKADVTLNGALTLDIERHLPLFITLSGSMNLQHNELTKSSTTIGEVNINSRKFTLNIVFEW